MASNIGQQMSMDRDLFLPGMTIQAMRDSRYRHVANAVAELIDNSIDANATRVDLLIRERQELVSERRRWRPTEIAVVDNGHGMSDETLVQALRFGGRQPPTSIQHIGKYGMGLPTASVSQCKRLDVWTWQESIDHPSHSFIDVGAIEDGRQRQIPEPDHASVPDEWRMIVDENTLDARQGTIVVWSAIDRITAQSETIFRQVEKEIGRIYRHFLNDRQVAIRMASFREGQLLARMDTRVRPNDPLYLMRNTSNPEPWNIDPMFQFSHKREFPVDVGGRQELVEVTYSIVKQEALGEQAANPGILPHGQDARRNMGVSVVRENREILVDNSFVREGGRGNIPMNRWWGCEVRFSSGCDDLFGVDHNKQVTVAFSNAARELLNSESDTSTVLRELGVEDDDLYRIVADIRNTTRSLMDSIDVMFGQRQHTRNRASGEQPSVQEQATELAATATRHAIERGDEARTATDREREERTEQERIDEIEEYLQESGLDQDAATRLGQQWVQNDRWYSFLSGQLAGNQMFSVQRQGGVLNVRLNIHHPVYAFLEVIREEAEESGNEVARRAALGVITMLLAWARMEDQIENDGRRRRVQDIATDWGRQVNEVLSLLNQSDVT